LNPSIYLFCRGVQLTLMSAHMSVSERFSLTLTMSADTAHAHAHGERERLSLTLI